MSEPTIRAVTAEAQAAVRGMVVEARAAASNITAEAQRASVATIGSIQQSVTGAVADAAHRISADFATLVNKQLTTMTENFKRSNPEIDRAVTEVVGYAGAVGEVSSAVGGAAGELKKMPAAVKGIREGLAGTVKEAGNLGRDLRTMGTQGSAALRNLGGAAGGAVRSLAQLATGYARAGAAAAVNTARTLAMNLAQKVVAVATRLWAAAQALLNLAMRLNPIGLIITAITVVIGLIVLAYQRSGTFRAVVQAAMRAAAAAIGWVVNAAKAVVSWIKDHWPLLLAILTGPIGVAVAIVVRNWDRIKAGAVAAKDGVVHVWDLLVGWVSRLGGRIGQAARGMWDGIREAFRAAVDWVIRGWNGIEFRIPGFSVGPVHFGGFVLGLPDIPELAEGGLVPHRPGGVLALLGEGREDELVVPLSRIGSVAGGLAGSVTVNVYPRAGQSEYEIGRIAARELAWAAKR